MTEVVIFTLRYKQYGTEMTQQFETTEDAVAVARNMHDFGEACCFELWDGDAMMYSEQEMRQLFIR